jgi:hypothetical protein
VNRSRPRLRCSGCPAALEGLATRTGSQSPRESLSDSEAVASSPGLNIRGRGNERRTGFKAICHWQTADDSEMCGSWHSSWPDSELGRVGVSLEETGPERDILGIEQRTVVQCGPAGGPATRTRSQGPRLRDSESEAAASSSLGLNTVTGIQVPTSGLTRRRSNLNEHCPQRPVRFGGKTGDLDEVSVAKGD